MAADTAEQAPAEDTPPRTPETSPVWDLTVDQAMVMVMREIGAVGKNGTNEEFGYSYRQQEDLVAAARGPMAKYGVRMLPRVIDQKHFQRGKSNVAILTIEYVVRGPAGDVMEPSIVVVGEGADVSDKASNKAMTAGKKYALVQAFEIAESSVDDGDHTSPDTEASPLDWYVNQLRREDVWFNHAALGRIRERVLQYGHGGLLMPDDSGLTLLQTIEERGAVLMAVQAEREGRAAEERGARDAQMRAEHPEYHRASPDDEVWQRQPSRPAPQATGQPTHGPDPVEVERRLAEAVSDPQTAVKRLNELRKHYTPAALKDVQVQTQWGQVDGNSAITFALKEVAQRPPAPATPAPAEQQEHQRAAEPAAPSEPPAQPQPAPPAVRPEPQPEPGTPTPAVQQEAPAQSQSAAPAAQPQRAAAPRTMTSTERARHRLECEVEFQAQMLGMPTLEFVADLLPANATSVEDIPGNFKLQTFIIENRPAVIEALIAANMHRQAEEYTALGQRAPAPNIERIISSALSAQSSL